MSNQATVRQPATAPISTIDLAAATRFMAGHARAVEHAIFLLSIGDPAASTARVERLIEGYQNADGGFGLAMEPDLRTPASQPLHTEVALYLLQSADIKRPDLADAAAGWLARIADADGATPAYLPGALDYPAAIHWQGDFGRHPSLNRTLILLPTLHWHGCSHPWLDHAVQACRQHLTSNAPAEAHELKGAIWFAETFYDGPERTALLQVLGERLQATALFKAAADDEGYGLTPLAFAPSPTHPCSGLFAGDQMDAHLKALAAAQQPDGGWAIKFEPPTEAARWEWRGHYTLAAVQTLLAWRRKTNAQAIAADAPADGPASH